VNDAPADPTNQFAVGAIAMHEVFKAYMEAGFTREEAFKVVLVLLSNNKPQ